MTKDIFQPQTMKNTPLGVLSRKAPGLTFVETICDSPLINSTNMKKHLYGLALVLLVSACSKSKDGDADTGTTPGTGGATGITQMGAGMVYYDWATEGILKVDLKTGVKGQALQGNTRRNSWDISRDNTWLLEVTDAPQSYDDELYTITNIKDGTLVAQFIKETGYANHSSPKFSFDKKLLAVPPTYDDGIMVLDLKGNILLNVVTFQGKKLEGEVEWMPDNTLLFRLDNSLYRSNKEFTQANLVTTLNFAEWNDFTVSPDGSKIALRGGNHLWMMNADGSNLTQITESNFKEVMPVFSPDSKYLLIGYDYTITGTFGRY
jgi:dipeptidyl aminopeptidase/acylaminoacyl peptidase